MMMNASKLLAVGDVIGKYQMKSGGSPFTDGGAPEHFVPTKTPQPGILSRMLEHLRPARNVFRTVRQGTLEPVRVEGLSEAGRPSSGGKDRKAPFENLRAVCNDLSDSDFEIVKRAGGGLLLRV